MPEPNMLELLQSILKKSKVVVLDVESSTNVKDYADLLCRIGNEEYIIRMETSKEPKQM
jgi:hypothetical protein